MPSANTLPVRISAAALTMSCGVTWLRVPIWSSAPQRPQFLSFSEACAIAFLPTVMSMAFPSLRSLGWAPDFGAGESEGLHGTGSRSRRLRIQPLHFGRRHAGIRHRHRRGITGEPGRKRT